MKNFFNYIIEFYIKECYEYSFFICEKINELKNLEINNEKNSKSYTNAEKELIGLLKKEKAQYDFFRQDNMQQYLLTLYNDNYFQNFLSDCSNNQMYNTNDDLSNVAMIRTITNICYEIESSNAYIFQENCDLEYCNKSQLKNLLSLKRKINKIEKFVLTEFYSAIIFEITKLINIANISKDIRENLINYKYEYLFRYGNIEFESFCSTEKKNQIEKLKLKYENEIAIMKEKIGTFYIEQHLNLFLNSSEQSYWINDNLFLILSRYATLKASISMVNDDEKNYYGQTVASISKFDCNNSTGKGMIALAFGGNPEEIKKEFEHSLKSNIFK